MDFRKISELNHPGFVLFEGIDFTGKTSISQNIVQKLKECVGLDSKYNHNQGFLDDQLADTNFLRDMNPIQKSNHFLHYYLSDFLPTDPKKFSEIFQDRHLPSLVFYAIIRARMKLENMRSHMDSVVKPKHIFLFECNYDERVKRAQKRKSFKELERIGISSLEAHEKLISIYRKIIQLYGVPYTIIDTSNISKDTATEICINTLNKSEILVYDVPIEELFVDFESKVYPPTAEKRLKELLQGEKLKPITITRKINNKDEYINIIIEGRHRAYASWKGKVPLIKSYINYKYVRNIDKFKLNTVSQFGFK